MPQVPQAQTHPLPAPLNGLAWLENPQNPEAPTLATWSGNGQLHLLRAGMNAPLSLTLTPNQALLAATATPHGLVTASENGQLHLTTAQGESTLLTTLPHKFPEHLAYHPKTNLLIWAAGKHAGTLNFSNPTQTQTLQAPSTIGGLALSPLGPRLAISHYGGTSIYNLQNLNEPPRQLPWKGSHLALTYSPNGKWLISSMQEQALHLWRLSDGMDLQMRGYPGPITQFSWSNCGNWLATNGGSGVPLWHFANKAKSEDKGPAGQQAKVIAESGSPELLVTSIAYHPQGPFIAIGYSDGLTLLTNSHTNASHLLTKPIPQVSPTLPKDDPIHPQSTPNHTQNITNTTQYVAWSPNGLYLAEIQNFSDKNQQHNNTPTCHLTLTSFHNLT